MGMSIPCGSGFVLDAFFRSLLFDSSADLGIKAVIFILCLALFHGLFQPGIALVDQTVHPGLKFFAFFLLLLDDVGELGFT